MHHAGKPHADRAPLYCGQHRQPEFDMARPHDDAPACTLCPFHQVCRSAEDITPSDELLPRDVVPTRVQLRAGQMLYLQGRPALAVYPLRNGCVKSMFESPLGWRQITSFTLPGDVLGLEAHDGNVHTTSAIALQDVSCCVVPVETLRAQMHASGFRALVLDTLRRNTEHERTLLVAIGSMKAAQRLAMLLLDLAREHERRGGTDDELTLAMSRNDIASYLGLTLETVSRLLSRFASAGLITVRHKLLHIVDQPGLAAVYADAGHLPVPRRTNRRDTTHASRRAA